MVNSVDVYDIFLMLIFVELVIVNISLFIMDDLAFMSMLATVSLLNVFVLVLVVLYALYERKNVVSEHKGTEIGEWD